MITMPTTLVDVPVASRASRDRPARAAAPGMELYEWVTYIKLVNDVEITQQG